jgi:hypothetical protein
MGLDQESANYGPQANSRPLLVNKILCEHSQDHLFTYLLSAAAFLLQQQSWVVATETI